jgi:hypothetical protein
MGTRNARRLAGEDATYEAIEIARRIAEVQIDLIRIRRARRELLARNISDPEYQQIEVFTHNTKLAKRIGRRIGMLTPIPSELMSLLRSQPQGAHKILAILSELAKQFIAMDRYERRALSRRKFAIRALDDLRRQAAA